MGYQLHSDQLAHKITGVSQSKGARLVSYTLYSVYYGNCIDP